MASPDVFKSSDNISKRFYVGNLFPNVSDIDLRKLFVKYGDVKNVEIKNKRDIDGNNIATFAFVTIDLKNASDNMASQCIRDCNNLKWKRNVIKVQVAQESFLQRLQNERQNMGKAQSPASSYDPLEIMKRHKESIKNNTAKDNLRYMDKSDSQIKDELAVTGQQSGMGGKASKGVIVFSSEDEESQTFSRVPKTHHSKRKIYHSSSDEEQNVHCNKVKQKMSEPRFNKGSEKINSKINALNDESNKISTPNKPQHQTVVKKVNERLIEKIVGEKQNGVRSKPTIKKPRYYSSSSDEDEDWSHDRKKLSKRTTQFDKLDPRNSKARSESFLTKLESFDSSFWHDKHESDEPRPASPQLSDSDESRSKEEINFDKRSDDKRITSFNGESTDLSKSTISEKSPKLSVLEIITRKGKKSSSVANNSNRTDDSTTSFKNSMLRFDPAEKSHEKFEIKKSSENSIQEGDIQEEDMATEEKMVAKTDAERSKTFWMSTTFANNLLNKMKLKDDVTSGTSAKGPLREKSAFSFGFNLSDKAEKNEKHPPGFSLLNKFGETKSKGVSVINEVEIIAKKPNLLQYDSSDEDCLEATASTKVNGQNKLIEGLRLKKSELSSSEKFGLKLKEKAVAAGAIISQDTFCGTGSNVVEPFFFTANDKRFDEGLSFLKDSESMDELRTKFEEKRPILAEILRKKMRNRAKKQEQMSFGSSGKKVVGKRRKFNRKNMRRRDKK